MHCARVACDTDIIMDIAAGHGLLVAEDAAQAIDAGYTGKRGHRSLGSIGHLAAFSSHETKNIISVEGGPPHSLTPVPVPNSSDAAGS